jgi:hypothetical protein
LLITLVAVVPQTVAPRAAAFGGTIIVVGISKDEIVLAADSRVSLNHGSQDVAVDGLRNPYYDPRPRGLYAKPNPEAKMEILA